MLGWSQRDIATTLSLAEKTVSEWAIAGGWKTVKIKKELIGFQMRNDMEEVLSYQIAQLKKKISIAQQQEEATGEIVLLQSKDFDAIYKAYLMIKPQETAWSEKAEIMTELLTLIKDEYPEHAAVFVEIQSKYLERARKDK